MHHICGKCKKLFGLLILLLGVAFLLVDLGKWTFWNINWWTVVFLFMGLKVFCICSCPECKDAMKVKKK